MEDEKIKTQRKQEIDIDFDPIYFGQIQNNAQPLGYAQGIPIGQPVSQQPYQHSQVDSNQMIFMPVSFEQSNIIDQEKKIKDQMRCFSGCNLFWGFMTIINLMTGSFYIYQSTEVGIILILERNIVLLISIAIGLYGISKLNGKYLFIYVIGLWLVIILHSLALFLTLTNIESQANDGGVYIIFYIISMFCIFSFMQQAKKLRLSINLLNSMKDKNIPMVSNKNFTNVNTYMK